MNAISKAYAVSRKAAAKTGPDKRRGHYTKQGDDELLTAIRRIVDERPQYGYRRVARHLNQSRHDAGLPAVNLKRVFRLMSVHGLTLRAPNRKPTRTHKGRIMVDERNTRWCSDIFTIQCDNGERVVTTFALDCCDREVFAFLSSTKGIDSEMIRDLMVEAVEKRFGTGNTAPRGLQWLTDNGPQYTAHATVAFGRELGLDICTTPAYSPQSNGMAEAWVKTIKRDYVAFADLTDARSVLSALPNWIEDYNEKAPHSALKYRSPREFIRARERNEISNEKKRARLTGSLTRLSNTTWVN